MQRRCVTSLPREELTPEWLQIETHAIEPSALTMSHRGNPSFGRSSCQQGSIWWGPSRKEILGKLWSLDRMSRMWVKQ
jgi:hypothetical protein